MGAVWQAIARSLSLAPRPVNELKDEVLNFLASKRMLLILDNCEQVRDWAGSWWRC
jgi:predicted ATPase